MRANHDTTYTPHAGRPRRTSCTRYTQELEARQIRWLRSVATTGHQTRVQREENIMAKHCMNVQGIMRVDRVNGRELANNSRCDHTKRDRNWARTAADKMRRPKVQHQEVNRHERLCSVPETRVCRTRHTMCESANFQGRPRISQTETEAHKHAGQRDVPRQEERARHVRAYTGHPL